MAAVNNEEIEAKVLGIDPVALASKIESLGGVKQFDRTFRRYSFDYPDLRLNAVGAWVRLRDEGSKITMAYKQRVGYDPNDPGKGDTSMIEHEVEISDIETAANMLRAIGLKEKFYEENRRIEYMLDGVQLDIDHWPLLDPYLEVEAQSWEEVDAMITKLGFDPADKKIYPTYELYRLAGHDENDFQILTFDKQIKKS